VDFEPVFVFPVSTTRWTVCFLLHTQQNLRLIFGDFVDQEAAVGGQRAVHGAVVRQGVGGEDVGQRPVVEPLGEVAVVARAAPPPAPAPAELAQEQARVGEEEERQGRHGEAAEPAPSEHAPAVAQLVGDFAPTLAARPGRQPRKQTSGTPLLPWRLP